MSTQFVRKTLAAMSGPNFFYVSSDCFKKKLSVMRDLIGKFSVMCDWNPSFATMLH